MLKWLLGLVDGPIISRTCAAVSAGAFVTVESRRAALAASGVLVTEVNVAESLQRSFARIVRRDSLSRINAFTRADSLSRIERYAELLG